MTININNQSQSVLENTSISTLLEQLNIVSKGVAIAVNDIVISKTAWDETCLHANDSITIIQATQGG
ncbi:hypothetical protein GCM10022393_16600 [Aquimarina addita]|uniref:Sulfur carrier protein ThiS n=1 Tax=Aquimarina addita TaxID=870485 RepID=A0ABP7XJ91_9FLAO